MSIEKKLLTGKKRVIFLYKVLKMNESWITWKLNFDDKIIIIQAIDEAFKNKPYYSELEGFQKEILLKQNVYGMDLCNLRKMTAKKIRKKYGKNEARYYLQIILNIKKELMLNRIGIGKTNYKTILYLTLNVLVVFLFYYYLFQSFLFKFIDLPLL